MSATPNRAYQVFVGVANNAQADVAAPSAAAGTACLALCVDLPTKQSAPEPPGGGHCEIILSDVHPSAPHRGNSRVIVDHERHAVLLVIRAQLRNLRCPRCCAALGGAGEHQHRR
jgi:hypothetical protein